MPKAEWNGVVVAEAPADKVVIVEGNVYFPPEYVKKEYFSPSSHTSECSWKGHCNYYNLVVNGKTNEKAVWYYADPLPAAKQIKGYFAFWKGVKVTK
jgi:uncharacterized protein (DUF427 family)